MAMVLAHRGSRVVLRSVQRGVGNRMLRLNGPADADVGPMGSAEAEAPLMVGGGYDHIPHMRFGGS